MAGSPRTWVPVGRIPYDFVVVDEAQDLSVAQLRFIAALGAGRPDALFFAGDLGQRIFQLPFSWLALGVDIRGRSATLRVNYRTSHQIRMHADRLLGQQVSDVDGNTEGRADTISVFNGPPPVVRVLESAGEESAAVGRWLAERAAEGVAPRGDGVFVRSEAEVPRARAALEAASLPAAVLDDAATTVRDRVSIGTMHLSKGLEFRAVAVMACDDEVIPLQARIQAVGDDSDLAEVYETERHLLYVACTRARDHLLVTGVTPASEFLDDLGVRAEAQGGHHGREESEQRCHGLDPERMSHAGAAGRARADSVPELRDDRGQESAGGVERDSAEDAGGAPAPLGTPAPASIRPGELSIKLGSSSLRVARSGEILQLHNGLNQLNSKLQSLATDDPDEWQRVVQDYVVMASALYVTLNDDDS